MRWALVALLILTAAASGCGSARQNKQPSAPSRSPFSVLGERPTGSDALPRWVWRRLRESSRPAMTNVDLRSARQILGVGRAWLIPAGVGELCLARLVAPLPSVTGSRHYPPAVDRSCTTRGAACAGRLMQLQYLSTSSESSAKARVVGVVPDDVHRVVVDLGGGNTRMVAVARNAYQYSGVAPRSVSFSRASRGVQGRYLIRMPAAAPANPPVRP
jgi:hypothetical protein